MKNILLPTDFSKNSLNAIHYAIELFKDNSCNFYLLNVFKIPYFTNEALLENDSIQLTKMENDLFESSQKGLKNLIKKLDNNPKHNFTTLSEYNFFINSVKNTQKDKDIDLIVMGTKGATGAKEIFMGSNTGDVIMKTQCNVLAIPENTSFEKPTEIAFPTDYEISYQKEEFELLINIANTNNSKLRIVHFQNKNALNEEQRLNKKRLLHIFKNLDFRFHTLTSADFEVGLNCFTQSRGNIDMIAIIAKHYNFFQRLFFKPKVEELSFHTTIPLLVLHKTK